MEPPRATPRNVLARVVTALVLVVATAPLVAHGEADATRRGTLLVIGDSLTVGAAGMGGFDPRLRSLAAWDEIVVDARVGRSARAGAAVLARRLADTDDVEAVVVALGTNDMAGYRDMVYARSVIDGIMSRARDLPVLWINLEFAASPRPDRRSRGERFNAQLVRATGRWPNLVVSDWNTWFTPRGATRFVADGMHLTASGYRSRSRFMISEIARLARWIDTGGTTSTTSSTPPGTTIDGSTSTSTTMPTSTSTTTADSSTTTSVGPSTTSSSP